MELFRPVEVALRVVEALGGGVAAGARLGDLLAPAAPLHLGQQRPRRVELRSHLIEARLLLGAIEARERGVGTNGVPFTDGDRGDPSGDLEAQLRLGRLGRSRGKEPFAVAPVADLMGDDDDRSDHEDPHDRDEPPVRFHGLYSRFWASQSGLSCPVIRASSTRATISR